MSEEEINEDQGETQDNEEVEQPVQKTDVRLKKSVDLLLKQTKLDPKKMEGMSLEEQFDKLSFLLENIPEPKKEKNKPVVPLPTDPNQKKIGRVIKDVGGKEFYLFKPNEWINQPKKK